MLGQTPTELHTYHASSIDENCQNKCCQWCLNHSWTACLYKPLAVSSMVCLGHTSASAEIAHIQLGGSSICSWSKIKDQQRASKWRGVLLGLPSIEYIHLESNLPRLGAPCFMCNKISKKPSILYTTTSTEASLKPGVSFETSFRTYITWGGQSFENWRWLKFG